MRRASSSPRRRAAHSILDRAVAGDRISAAAITKALQATGDLEPGEVEVQVVTPTGKWERQKVLALLTPATWLDGLL